MKQKIGIVKFGGITLVISGILFLAQSLFLLPLSSPPSSDTELMTWLQKWRFPVAMADELFFFATLFLVPSIAALYRILRKADQIKALTGCGLLVILLPINLMLDIILGRLVYPVYHMELSSDLYRLVLSIYYGGMHLAAILLGIATILLSLAIRKSAIGKFTAYFGFITGILDFIGAYPWLIGTVMTFVSQLFFSVWFILLGVGMLGSRQEEAVSW